MTPMDEFVRDYVQTGRLKATLLKLKVRPSEVEDAAQAVVLHFLNKNFLEIYDPAKGSLSNHVFVGIRNFVVDQFRYNAKHHPQTLVLVTRTEEDGPGPYEVSEEVIADPNADPDRVSNVLYLREKATKIMKPSQKDGWRDVVWTADYYQRISELLLASRKMEDEGRNDTAYELEFAAKQLNALQGEKFGHYLVYIMRFELDLDPKEIARFTGASESRITCMLQESLTYIGDRAEHIK